MTGSEKVKVRKRRKGKGVRDVNWLMDDFVATPPCGEVEQVAAGSFQGAKAHEGLHIIVY
jgi:hypothetical protein